MSRWLLFAVLVGVLWVLDTWFFNGFFTDAILREVNHVAQLINDWAENVTGRIQPIVDALGGIRGSLAITENERRAEKRRGSADRGQRGEAAGAAAEGSSVSAPFRSCSVFTCVRTP